MSNMENLESQLSEQERQTKIYEDAVASINADKNRKSAQGYAMMASISGYGEGAMGTGTFGKITHGCKLFLIAFALLVPSLLVWRVLL